VGQSGFQGTIGPASVVHGAAIFNLFQAPMTVWQLILHLFNFVLPALAMAVLMPWVGRWVMGTGGASLRRRMTAHALAGVLVLVAGLVLQGHDGKMSIYMVLVLVAATVEWAMHRGWARK
jgi:hypothetical protein